MGRLYHRLADADQNVEELGEEVEALAESRAIMRVEIHETHCQVCVFHPRLLSSLEETGRGGGWCLYSRFGITPVVALGELRC